MKSEIAQLCLTLFDPVDCSPPGSSVHGILQARILEWVVISFSKGLSKYQRRASQLWTGPSPTGGREAGVRQPEPERGKLSPRDGILYQTASSLPIANQVFLGSWKVDVCQEGHSQRSALQRRYTAHLRRRSCCAPRKPSSWPQGGDKMHHPTWGEYACQAPGVPFAVILEPPKIKSLTVSIVSPSICHEKP